MAKTKRSRTYVLSDKFTGSMRYMDSYAGPIKNWVGVNKWPAIKGTQITESEGHPFHEIKRGKMKDDLGGEFFTTKNYILGTIRPTVVRTANYPGPYTWSEYNGPIVRYPASAPWPPPFPPEGSSSRSSLEKQGATAIARCSPTNSIADASTFLGELLKDGLPSIPGHQTKVDVDKFRSFGSEYLNYIFGWRPIISDVKKFYHAVHHADKVLKQYERDAGRVVRRRYYFPVSRQRETLSFGSSNAKYHPGDTDLNAYVPFGNWTREREIVRRVWFSGAFTYYLPSDYDSRKAMDRYALMAEKVFGLSLSPEVLWNLAPWSWAADWFGNAGDVLSNVSSRINDGLVMRYGYVMEHTVTFDSYRISQTAGYRQLMSDLVLVTETKKRIRANPYGFGVSWDGLSPYQLSVLAALGISKR